MEQLQCFDLQIYWKGRSNIPACTLSKNAPNVRTQNLDSTETYES